MDTKVTPAAAAVSAARKPAVSAFMLVPRGQLGEEQQRDVTIEDIVEVLRDFADDRALALVKKLTLSI
jgi:hypothetical protein